MNDTCLVPIVFSFDDAMRYPALVCIGSLLRAAQPSTYYDIFILYAPHRLSERNRRLFQQFVADRYGHQARLTLIAVPTDIEETLRAQTAENEGYLDADQRISVDTYYRLMIPTLITGYDTVIYSDIDMLFRGDLSELLSVDMARSSLGACRDYDMLRAVRNHAVAPTPGVYLERYFNAGFLLFNVAKIRAQKTMELPTMITMMKKQYRLADQDVLNVLFGNDYITLSPRYNYAFLSIVDPARLRQRARRIRPIVYHYAGLFKPWNNMPAFGWLWINALLKTKAPPSAARAFRRWKYQTLCLVCVAFVTKVLRTIYRRATEKVTTRLSPLK